MRRSLRTPAKPSLVIDARRVARVVAGVKPAVINKPAAVCAGGAVRFAQVAIAEPCAAQKRVAAAGACCGVRPALGCVACVRETSGQAEPSPVVSGVVMVSARRKVGLE